jgi:hypothetical protein
MNRECASVGHVCRSLEGHGGYHANAAATGDQTAAPAGQGDVAYVYGAWKRLTIPSCWSWSMLFMDTLP